MSAQRSRPRSLAHGGDPTQRKRRPRLANRWRNPIGLFGAGVVAFMAIVAIAAPWIAPHSPSAKIGKRLLGPARDHLLGTDELGRDTFSRVVFGARVSFQVSIIAVLVALIAGGLLGLLAGYFGGWFDSVAMRLVDILFAFPGLVLAIVIAGLLGPSRNNAMLAIGIIYSPAFARVVRGSVLSVMSEPYVESGRVIGASNARIIFRTIAPNIVAPMIVLTTVYLSSAVLAEAGLSFLGLGAQPPQPSWGGMLNSARTYMQIQPWLAVAPGAAIMLLVLGLNFLGDGLRDLLDPRLRSR